MSRSVAASGTRHKTCLQAIAERRHLTREQTLQVLERKAQAMGVTDFTLSLRQLDRWYRGQLTKRPRASVCRVVEAEFGYNVDMLLAPENEAPSLASPTTSERLASVEVDDTILVDEALYQLLSLDFSDNHVGGRLGLTRFAAYALTCDLLEGELLDSLNGASGQHERDHQPLRDMYLPRRESALAFEQRVCAGGPACLLAIARPDDYLLLVQKRSSRVVNVVGRLAVIPKAFHQPLTDDRDATLSATIDRELEEELLGRPDLELLAVEDGRRAAPLHPNALSEPMRWLIDHPDAYQVETTGFGINMLGGNYEFACLVLIEDPAWWDRYGDRVQANWEAARILCYSSRDTDGLARLAADPTWSNEGLFAYLEGLRRLATSNPAKTAIPPISVTC